LRRTPGLENQFTQVTHVTIKLNHQEPINAEVSDL